jgi:hypothetical protein
MLAAAISENMQSGVPDGSFLLALHCPHRVTKTDGPGGCTRGRFLSRQISQPGFLVEILQTHAEKSLVRFS